MPPVGRGTTKPPRTPSQPSTTGLIVIFGASSAIGKRVADRLLSSGSRVRLISRDPKRLDPRAEQMVGDASMAGALTSDANVVVSCAHAHYARSLIEAAPQAAKFIFLSSAWRYSSVPNPLADEVREAELCFLASGRNGVMLHTTMIYGADQDKALNLLMAAVRKFPVLPIPGGGRNLVQPIHIDDLAACIVSAVERAWKGPTIISVAGPQPLEWRAMAVACAKSAGRTRMPMISVPLRPSIHFLKFAERLGFKFPLRSDAVQRFQEDVCVSIDRMTSELGVIPRPFSPSAALPGR